MCTGMEGLAQFTFIRQLSLKCSIIISSHKAIVVVPDLYRGRPWTAGVAAKFDSVRAHHTVTP